MAFLRLLRSSCLVSGSGALAAALMVSLIVSTQPVLQGQSQGAYTLLTPDGRRSLPFRTAGGTDVVPLDQLANLFGLKFMDDTLAGGLVIETRGQRIFAVPGQSFVQAAGKVVALSGPIQRERNAWQVPVDFLSLALGPATGQRIVVRRASHLILVGDIRVPQVSGRLERTAGGGRLVLEIQPATPSRVTREGDRLVVRFDAAALDPGAIAGQVPDFVSSVRFEGTTVVVELGPSAATYRTDDRTETHLAIELLPPAPAGAPPPPPPAPQEPPAIDLSPGAIRTVVIDPGHGGDDQGARGPAGTKEKDYTLQIARRLKAAIESRMGLRVLLTRDGDENVPIDRRTALANNNKADLLLSLHANASVRASVRGAQVLTLSVNDYPDTGGATDPRRTAVPIIGGGTRNIDPVRWDLAQLPVAGKSSTLGAILIQHLTERSVPLFSRAALQMPLRLLVGANMPAVLIEMGFLTNAADEKALTQGDLSATIVEAILVTIADVRRGIPDPAQKRSGR